MVTGARLSDLKSVLLHLVVGRAPHVQLLMLLCVVLHWASQGKLKCASLQIYSGADTKLSAKTSVKLWWDGHIGLW